MPPNGTHHPSNRCLWGQGANTLCFSLDEAFAVWGVGRSVFADSQGCSAYFSSLSKHSLKLGHARLIYDSGMLNSHTGIWPAVTLFCTLPAASYIDNYQRLIYRCQQERKWSEWLPTAPGIEFYQESQRTMFVLKEKKIWEVWLVKNSGSKMSYSKRGAGFKVLFENCTIWIKTHISSLHR